MRASAAPTSAIYAVISIVADVAQVSCRSEQMVGTNEPRAVSGTGPGAQPRWTVGSLLGVPLGAEPAPVPVPPPSHDLGRAAVLAAPVAATAPALVEEEGPWTIAR